MTKSIHQKPPKHPQFNVRIPQQYHDYVDKHIEEYNKVDNDINQADYVRQLIEHMNAIGPGERALILKGRHHSPYEYILEILEHWVWTDHSLNAEIGWAIENLSRFPQTEKSLAIKNLVQYRMALAWLSLSTIMHAEALGHLLSEAKGSSDFRRAESHYKWAIKCAWVSNAYNEHFFESDPHRLPAAFFNVACCYSLIAQYEVELEWFRDPERRQQVKTVLESTKFGPKRISRGQNPTAEYWKTEIGPNWRQLLAKLDSSEIEAHAAISFEYLNRIIEYTFDQPDVPAFTDFIIRRASFDQDLTFLRYDSSYRDEFVSRLGKQVVDVCAICDKLLACIPDEIKKNATPGRKA